MGTLLYVVCCWHIVGMLLYIVGMSYIVGTLLGCCGMLLEHPCTCWEHCWNLVVPKRPLIKQVFVPIDFPSWVI